jgi:diaminopimelate epimerase
LVKKNEELIAEALLSNLEELSAEDAIGIMFYDKERCSLKPFVYVKTAGTKVWERGCGSRTAAVGAYLAFISGKNITADIAQPGGLIRVEAALSDGKLSNLTVEGKIAIVAEGKAYIPF